MHVPVVPDPEAVQRFYHHRLFQRLPIRYY
jgi:hypothetical protein